jgi:uncharacterized protein (TIGR02600 family)
MRHRGKRRDSFALVMVLVALAVMSVLLLALFGGASHQARGAQGDAASVREKMLGDTVAALVIGQIEQATTQPGQAWISQPGMLRTYKAVAARTPAACYKLYSSTQMIDTSGSLAFLAGDVPADWNSTANASVYTDLNALMQTLGGTPIYPILDARAILPVTINGTTDSEVPGVSSDAGHAVEMPVAWLYELKDGTLGSPGAATASNPIVARAAFWTDDETSKIDINTAGEASPWNPPHADSADDVAWATTQPAAGEYPRYPGHPASVSLSTVFGTNTSIGLTPDQLLALTPRYASGGSDFGANTTTASSSVTPKTDRLYATLDELCFGAALDSSGRRVPGAITPDNVNLIRFVLTAHSHAPETTLLGEPRVSIWPVSDALDDPTKTTATDRALAAAATVGDTPYYFQRTSATSPQNDLNLAVSSGNTTLFNNLIASGSKALPGSGVPFAQKYTGAQWPQLVLEILDAIRGFNAIDPAAPPLTGSTSGASSSTTFVPFAAGDGNGVGRGLVEPLSVTYQRTALRGLGRYPTLFGLTFVFYVSGFEYTDGTGKEMVIDYDGMDPAAAAASWQTNFAPTSSTNVWAKVDHALVRAFVVPTTFQPGCGFPEVSDGCTLQIGGLDGLTATSDHVTEDFGFAKLAISRPLSDALTVPPADRAWGGFEGPLAWRAAALDAMNGGAPYAFAGTKAFAVPLSGTGDPSVALSWKQSFTVNALPGLTVQICDASQTVVQTCTVNLPSFAGQTPTIGGEADHFDGSTPATSHSDWATNPAYLVNPSYYMSLKNRLLATQRSRPLMIQAGDLSLSVEAKTDLRTMAALAGVPATCYGQATTSVTQTPEGGTQAHNLYFADGTSACFATPQTVNLANQAYAHATTSISVVDWHDGTTDTYSWATSLPCSAPTGTVAVTMAPLGSGATAPAGDWDTGLGFEPDGALVNLPDAGSTLDGTTAYQSLSGGAYGAATLRSPNALIPSPVIFGSLPAGIDPAHPAATQPWRTLLFCPYPSSDQAHPGLAAPPDYLLLDRFWMPTVEPYGISTCLDTAGKINLNDQIAPFTYLHRRTALRALLHGVRVPAISPAFSTKYKTAQATPLKTIWNTIDEDATVQEIEARFATGDAYLTEGEICSVPLIPTGVPAGTIETYWTSRLSGAGFLTGDNLRELPYAQLYNRLTTKSNSYTIHLHVQVLQKLNDHTDPAVWREGTDLVLGDWRGSYEIERYLDPAATAPAAGQPFPASAWKFRVVSAKRFTP